MSKPQIPSWNERYTGSEFYYGKEANDFLKEEAYRIPKGGRVLCLAEGEGRNAVWLARQGYQVTAVDGSSVGLDKMQAWARSEGLSIESQVCDLAHFSMGERSWDAIVSIWCHLPPALRAQVHGQIVRALKPGGLLLLEAYHPRQLEYKTGGPPVAEMMMTQSDLKAELAGMNFLIAREKDREIQEGRGHSGKSAVTQVIAQAV